MTCYETNMASGHSTAAELWHVIHVAGSVKHVPSGRGPPTRQWAPECIPPNQRVFLARPLPHSHTPICIFFPTETDCCRISDVAYRSEMSSKLIRRPKSENKYMLPTTDVLKHGCDKLVDTLLQLFPALPQQKEATCQPQK